MRRVADEERSWRREPRDAEARDRDAREAQARREEPHDVLAELRREVRRRSDAARLYRTLSRDFETDR